MKKVFSCIVLLVIMAVVFTACSSEEEILYYTGDAGNVSLEENEVNVLINETSVLINLDDEELIYNANQLTTEFDNEFVVRDTNGYEITIDGVAVVDNQIVNVSLDSLSSDEYVEITISDEEETYTVKIKTLNDALDFTAETTYEEVEGYYYFDYADFVVKVDTLGEVVFYKAATTGRNFQRFDIDGEVYYGYLEYSGNYTVDSSNSKSVRLTILDEEYNVIDVVETLSSDDGIVEGHSLENHEFLIIELGHYIVTGYVGMEVDNIPDDVYDGDTANVTAAVVQEIKDGELVYQWVSTDYEELYGLSMDGNAYDNVEDEYSDYMHLNSVWIDPSDDNLILSIRSMNAIVKIDKETNEIIWILGGEGDMFGITDEQQFNMQHFARISITGTLTIYDNGRDGVTNQSRTLEFVLDEENLEIISFEEFVVDGTYGSHRGSTTRLSEDEDIFMISWGMIQDDDSFLVEYNFDTDEALFTLYAGEDAIDFATAYRAYKLDN